MPNNQPQQLKDILECYRHVFATDEGKMVLLDLEKRCGMDTCAFDADNQHVTAFNLGQQNILLYIKKMLKLDISKLEKV